MQHVAKGRDPAAHGGAETGDLSPSSPTADTRPPSGGGSHRVGVGEAVARHPILTALLVLVGAGLGLAAGFARTPVYTSQATMRVTSFDLAAPGALSGLSTASSSLANTFALSVTSDAVVDPAAQRLRTSPDVVRGSVSGSAVPQSPVFTITAISTSPQGSRTIANAVAASLSDNVANQGKRASPDELLRRYDRQSRAIHRAQLKVAAAQHTYALNKSAANARAVAAERAGLETLILERASLQSLYRGESVNGNSSPRVQVLRQAEDGASDRATRLQIYLFAGLVLGALFGATLATMRANRRARRRSAVASAA